MSKSVTTQVPEVARSVKSISRISTSPMEFKSIATAPGKAILFGEHAVVYGTTAVAASLSDMRIKVETVSTTEQRGLVVTFEDIPAADGSAASVVNVSFEDIQLAVAKHEDPYVVRKPDTATTERLAQMFAAELNEVKSGMMSIVFLVGTILSDFVWKEPASGACGLTMQVRSLGLPIGAGLGSSAAFSVAVAASCLRLQALLYPARSYHNAEIVSACSAAGAGEVCCPSSAALDTINGWAFSSEILLHGSPSGLDNTTSCYGGLVRFSRKGGEKFENISGVPALHILLVNTRVPRSTKQLVAGVRVLHDAYTDAVVPMLDGMNNIALKFLAMVEELKGQDISLDSAAYDSLVSRTGTLMTMNHHLLNAVGVGHPALTALVEAAAAARYAHAASGEQRGFACKLTGAGGGGCAIILSPVPYCADKAADESAEGRDVSAALRALVEKIRLMGCDVHHSSIAGKGVVWLA